MPPLQTHGNEAWIPNASWLQRAAPSPVSSIGGGGPGAGANFREVVPIPWVCFAPGTEPEVVKAAQDKATGGFAGAKPGSEFHASAFQFLSPARWTNTATNVTTLRQGDSVTITWSIIPDGTAIPGDFGESDDPSDFNRFMNRLYGGRSIWLPIMREVFDRWAQNSRVRYVYEPNDDGAAFPDTPGERGVRGDVRVGADLIDGNSNVLAYNYGPGVGDMVVDTRDSFYEDRTANSQKLRNVLGHEAGHGLGLAHVCPINETKLMEPFVTTNFSGPQHDDIYASHVQYGDDFEDMNLDGFADHNNTPATASDLGIIRNGLTNLNPLSLFNDTDEDYLAFETVGHSSVLSVAIRPIGLRYDEASPDASLRYRVRVQFARSPGSELRAPRQLRNGARDRVGHSGRRGRDFHRPPTAGLHRRHSPST